MSEQKFGTGVQQEVEPLRIYDYEKTFGAISTTEEFPSYYRIPDDRIGIVKDQGSVGACVACVISSLAEVFEKMEAEKDGRNLTEEDVEFSEGWAYGALRPEGSNGYGMFLSSALEYWRKIGMLPKKYFNILEEMPGMRKRVNAFPELYAKANPYRINSYAKISYANREKRDLAVKDALYNKKYGLVAASYEGFTEPHCIMLIGWDDKKDKYIYKNSWGEKWGVDGISSIYKDRINEIYVVTDEELELPFVDVLKEDWYYGDIKNVYYGNLMNGMSQTEFKPLNNTTRAESAVLVGRLINLINDSLNNLVKILKIKNNNSQISFDPSAYLIKKIRENEMPFTDVSEKAWYYNDIKLAYEYGLINGKTQEIFDPQANITRAEIATLIERICEQFLSKVNYILKKMNRDEITETNNDIKFTDVSGKDWFYFAVKKVYNLEIMTGKTIDCFDPNVFTTRGEIAAIINRLSKYIDSTIYTILN